MISATKINEITSAYTSNLYLKNREAITIADPKTRNHYFTFQNIFADKNQIGSLNPKEEFVKKYGDTAKDIFNKNAINIFFSVFILSSFILTQYLKSS